MIDFDKIKEIINPKKNADKQFYLDLLDEKKQAEWEDMHVSAVLAMLKILYLARLSKKIREAEKEKKEILNGGEYDAEKYRRVLALNETIEQNRRKQLNYKCFFDEPYFARMDLTDDKDGYNSYYIGKHGDEGLEIVDWRAPLARRYYQKSKLSFSINQFDYKLVLRRAIRTHNGKVTDFKNEYLTVGGNLTKEEIDGRDAAVIFDPFLKEILSSRKEKREICDIIETIQEKQYEIITAPSDAQFVVQGVAGSGKTMILLHRLSFLMYNDETIKPSSILVLTPSDSFNSFIDELAQILELERVKTVTVEGYFAKLLKSAGIDFGKNVDFFGEVSADYLNYVYSENFVFDVRKKLQKIYDGIKCTLPADGDGIIADVLNSAEKQLEMYGKIKNSGLRVRRCVLGEIKEKPDGGLYYTKRMRDLFNCVSDVSEFLTLNSTDERMNSHAFFYRQLLSFYKSLRFICAHHASICRGAVADLTALGQTVEREITDIKRYKQRVGDKMEYIYPDRIEKREQTLKEVRAAIAFVEEIEYKFAAVTDLAEIIKGVKHVSKIGKCENVLGLSRYFYREVVKPVKQKYGVRDRLIKSDYYVMTMLLCELGFTLTPSYSFLFVDEAQDISRSEYEILRKVNPDARLNVFGDLNQNVTPHRGVGDWGALGYPRYDLNLNYRNTNQIVGFVSERLRVEMTAIGLNGEDVEVIAPNKINSYLSDKTGLRAVITSECNLAKYAQKSYNLVRESGKISKTKINIMTVYESKGLEFTAVAVVDGDMTDNEKYVAYTRALKRLALVRG